MINPWLHFKTEDNREFYVSKKHYRYSVNWNNIITVGAVSGTKTITINGKVYRIKLITGGTSATAPVNDWVDYIQGIYVDDPKRRRWVAYTLTDLEINEGATTYVTLCQEVAAANASNCALRGLCAIDAWNMNNKSTGGGYRGWRPFLELEP